MGEREEVQFSGKGLTSAAGSISAVGLATGVPFVLLKYGSPALSGYALLVLVSIAVIGGVVMGLMSAFFGLVLPSSVHSPHGHGEPPPRGRPQPRSDAGTTNTEPPQRP